MPTTSNAELALAAANTAVQAGGIIANSNIKKKTRKWNEKILNMQRDWALSDWNMQNEYNHPSSQMARLREAGLNPHLVYGKGADNLAAQVRTSSTPAWSPTDYDTSGLSQSLFGMYDIATKEAQVDNLRAQNTVLLQDALLKAAQTGNTLAGTDKTRQDITQSAGLFPYMLEAQQANVSKILTEIEQNKASTTATLDANDRANILFNPQLEKAVEDVLMKRYERLNIQPLEADIKRLHRDVSKLDSDLAKQGVRPGDPAYWKAIESILSAFLPKSDGKPETRKPIGERGLNFLKERLEWDKPWKDRKWKMW